MDFFRWYALPTNWRFMTGKSYLWYYKTAWLIHHRTIIKQCVIEEVLGKSSNEWSNATSVGSVAIQIGVAARTIGIHPDKLTHFQQFRLSQCLLDNHFNIRVVAFHLRDLILYDNPDSDTMYLTDEQIILAGSRYNRGTMRNKKDIIQSISEQPGFPDREYSEYGRRIIEKKDAILKIMRGG